MTSGLHDLLDDRVVIEEDTSSREDSLDFHPSSASLPITPFFAPWQFHFISDGGGPIANVTPVEGERYVTTVKAVVDPSTDWFLMSTALSLAGGADKGLFEFHGFDLRFKSPPDFSNPGDADGDGIYEVVVQAVKAYDIGVVIEQRIYVHTSVPVPPPPSVTAIGSGLDDIITPDFSSVGGPLPGRNADMLEGLQGNDVLSGGFGADVIIGGAGKDIMTGGYGADVFRFSAGDSKAGGGVRDIITDFQRGTDKLDLRGLNITNFDAQVSYKKVGSGLIVYVDVDNDGFDWHDFAVQLNGVTWPFLDQRDDFLYF